MSVDNQDIAWKDALSLCSQTAYPGDDELEAMEKEIMVKWKLNEAPDVQLGNCVQNNQQWKEKLQMARVALTEGKQCDALVYIDMAIEANPLNAALWLQRATILIGLGDLREAFRSCRALKPADRTADIWKMGGSILDKLGLLVSAESWFRKATKFSPEGDSSAAISFQKIRARRLYEPLTKDMPVEVTFTQQGRAVRAKRAVKKGDVIFADKPVLLAQTLPSSKFPCCANCARSLIRPEDIFSEEELRTNELNKAVKKYWPMKERFPCACAHEIYCSEECRRDAWENYHRLLCSEMNPGMGKLYELCRSIAHLTVNNCQDFQGWWSASFSPLLLAKLWAQIICSACSLAKDDGRTSPSSQDWALARAPYRRFIAYGSGIKADAFPKMHELMTEVFQDLGEGLTYPISKEEFSGRYLQLACNSQSFSDADNPLGDLCRGAHGDRQFCLLLNDIRKKEHEGDFAGLFPVHACLNHSCANNAFVSDGKTLDGRPGCHIKAKRDISAGEEVCNQYIDTNLSRKERRLILYRSYNFWCQCLRCQFQGDEPDICTECESKAEPGKMFPKCSRCKQAWYCSTHCQKKAWKRGHKKICGLEI